MSAFTDRLIICPADEVANHRAHQLTHILSVHNPGAHSTPPLWFRGPHMVLSFGDVISEADAVRCRTKAPTMDDVRRAVEFVTEAWRSPQARVLIHCDYGASRSPALAYVAVAKAMGSGAEPGCLQMILELRPSAVPNRLVVELGDRLLSRQGALLVPLKELYRRVSIELSSAGSSACADDLPSPISRRQSP